VEFQELSSSSTDKFDALWASHEEVLPDSAFQMLDEHLDIVQGKNRGKKSSAYTQTRNGLDRDGLILEIQNDALESTICHELGHAIADTMGVDTTSEATTRAGNKQNHSRWPQFSFGNKDSPPERFMLRRYMALPSLPRYDVTDAYIETQASSRADMFYLDDEFYEALTYTRTASPHERKRHMDPVMNGGIKLRRFGDDTHAETDATDLRVVDRYRLTPGLARALGMDVYEPEFDDPFMRLVQEINAHWYEAVTLVRKRGDKRERGQKMCPKQTKSYYLMNAHEYFAELHNTIFRNITENRYDDRVRRLETYVPDVVDAYRTWIGS